MSRPDIDAAMSSSFTGIAQDNGAQAASIETVRLFLQAMAETCEIYEASPSRENVRKVLLETFGHTVDTVIDQLAR